jgi:hypothetical protein
MTVPSYEATSNSSPAMPPPEPAPAGDGDLVPVFLLVGVRTSAGPGPGVKHLPPAEAASLLARKIAVGGSNPPRGWNLEVPS